MGWLAVTVYGLCFLLGLRNIYYILYKQRLYRAVLMTLQYVFGETICAFKICAFGYLGVDAHTITESGICYKKSLLEVPLDELEAFS